MSSLILYDEKAPLLFTGGQFLFWFSAFYAGFLLLASRHGARVPYLLLFSWFFYYKSSGGFLAMLLLTTLADFEIAKRIERARTARERKAWLVLALSASAGLLVYFKYTNFLAAGVARLWGARFEPWDIALPAGISFYTFQSLSYIVDVYRGELEASRSLREYALYLAYFPQIVAGPIVRAKTLLAELRREPELSAERLASGLFMVLLGLVKKAIVADYLARFTDFVFSGGVGLSGFELLLGVYGYAFQIYCDFSGYSDMAVGLGRLTGVELPENFRAPYAASSITEFWRRWHITLSTWLRDYVYIPLGGNRKGTARTLVNLLLTMAFGGLWHGARATFVFWGLAHGLLLCCEKIFASRLPQLKNAGWLRVFGVFVTFHLVALLWIPFRATDFGESARLVARIVGDFQLGGAFAVLRARAAWLGMLAVGAALSLLPRGFMERLGQAFRGAPVWARAVLLLVVVQATLEVREAEAPPFIYFQF